MKPKFFLPLIILISIILTFSGFFWWVMASGAPTGNSEEISFVIKKGSGANIIASNLKKENLIKNALAFKFYVQVKDYSKRIPPGEFMLPQNLSLPKLVKVLLKGPTQIWVTIPEGLRREQIADIFISSLNLSGEAAANFRNQFLQNSASLEGYLFPDTYRIPPQTSAKEIRQMMLTNFQKKIAGLGLTRDQLILASIIEREAKFDEDRPKIAGVYLNRLAQGMRLEADPTVQYAKGSWEPITVADYRNVISPYNTYLYYGLPPGPICNPGLKSIEAALHPEKNVYFYFFQTSDGHTFYSATLEEHQDKLKQLK